MSDDSRPIPPLRADVSVVPREGDDAFPALLVDAALEQRIRLEPMGELVARHLDRVQTLDELVQRLAVALPGRELPAEEVGDTVDGLRRVLVLADERAKKAVEERRRADAWLQVPIGDVPLVYAADARFDCTGCGGCCGGHNVGPVDAHVRERLATEEGRAFLAEHDLPDPPWWTGEEVTGTKGASEVMRSVGGWCVFLDEANRCRMHARFGGPSKPSVCQLFPLTFVLRPDGVAVSLQMECRDVLAGVATGRPFAEQEGDLRATLQLAPDPPRVRPVVPIDGMATLMYADYAALRDELVAAFVGPADAVAPDPFRALGRLRALVDARGRPRAEGPPAQVTRFSGSAELRDALHETVQQLGGQLVHLRRKLAREDGRRVVRTTSLDRVLGGLSQLVPALERVVRPPRDPAARELLRLLVVNSLLGEDVGSARSLRHGLTTLALRWVLARAIAIDRAHDVKRPEPTAQEHIDGLATVSFALRSPHVRGVIQKLATPLSLLFYDHLEDVQRYARDLAAPDRRIEAFVS